MHLSPIAVDPIAYLERHANSNLMREWRFIDQNHGVYRIGEQSVVSGTFRSRFNFDWSWKCDVCRPHKEKKEGARIKTAFEEHDMWLSIVASPDRDRAVRSLRDRGVLYVALPILMGGEVALLTVEPLFGPDAGSQMVALTDDFVDRTLMPMRWAGSLSSTRGFLPPEREYDRWEAHHPGSRRRCWHAHTTEPEARQCAVDTGTLLDGTSKGWYVRGCSVWRIMGRIGVTGSRLRELLNQSAIPSWDTLILDKRTGSDRLYVQFGPILWDDRRLAKVRNDARWTTPPGFEPPPFTLTMRVDVDTGRMTGTS